MVLNNGRAPGPPGRPSVLSDGDGSVSRSRRDWTLNTLDRSIAYLLVFNNARHLWEVEALCAAGDVEIKDPVRRTADDVPGAAGRARVTGPDGNPSRTRRPRGSTSRLGAADPEGARPGRGEGR